MRFRGSSFLPYCMALVVCAVAVHARSLSGQQSKQPAKGKDLNIATGREAPLPGKDYDQWTEAKQGTQATPPSAIHAPAGFEVDLLRSAQPGENSWVSMTFDPKGRILIAKEGTN